MHMVRSLSIPNVTLLSLREHEELEVKIEVNKYARLENYTHQSPIEFIKIEVR